MTWKIVDNFLFLCFNIAVLFSEATSQCHSFVKVAYKPVLSFLLVIPIHLAHKLNIIIFAKL